MAASVIRGFLAANEQPWTQFCIKTNWLLFECSNSAATARVVTQETPPQSYCFENFVKCELTSETVFSRLKGVLTIVYMWCNPCNHRFYIFGYFWTWCSSLRTWRSGRKCSCHSGWKRLPVHTGLTTVWYTNISWCCVMCDVRFRERQPNFLCEQWASIPVRIPEQAKTCLWDDPWTPIKDWRILAMARNPSRVEHQSREVHWGIANYSYTSNIILASSVPLLPTYKYLLIASHRWVWRALRWNPGDPRGFGRTKQMWDNKAGVRGWGWHKIL